MLPCTARCLGYTGCMAGTLLRSRPDIVVCSVARKLHRMGWLGQASAVLVYCAAVLLQCSTVAATWPAGAFPYNSSNGDDSVYFNDGDDIGTAVRSC